MTRATKDELRALAARVEAAQGADRDLDIDIAVAIGWLQPRCLLGTALRITPAYTASLDAALTLVPARALWSVCHMEDGPVAQLIRPMPCGGYVGGLIVTKAVTPALALTAAALRARAEELSESAAQEGGR